jgi:hypothetical protein
MSAKITQDKAPTAVGATGSETVKSADKTYSELEYHEEVVVQVGPRMRMHNNKAIEVEPARHVVFTKAGFEAMDRNQDGETTHIATGLLGIPEYTEIKDSAIIGGKRKVLNVLYFKDAASQEVTA